MSCRIGRFLLVGVLFACQSASELRELTPPPDSEHSQFETRMLLGTSTDDLWFHGSSSQFSDARIQRFDGSEWRTVKEGVRALGVAGPGAIWIAQSPIGRLHADGTIDDFSDDFDEPITQLLFGAGEGGAVALVNTRALHETGGWRLHRFEDGRFRKWQGEVPDLSSDYGSRAVDAMFGKDDFWVFGVAEDGQGRGWHFDGTGFRPVDLGPVFDVPGFSVVARAPDVWVSPPSTGTLLVGHYDGERWSSMDLILPTTYDENRPWSTGWASIVPLAPGRLGIFRMQSIKDDYSLYAYTYADGRVSAAKRLATFPRCEDSVSTPVCGQFQMSQLTDGTVLMFRTQLVAWGGGMQSFLSVVDPGVLP